MDRRRACTLPPAARRLRRAAGPAALGLLAVAMALAPPAAASHAEGLFCSPLWVCHFTLRPAEDRSADVWVNEASPGQNYDSPNEGSETLTIRAAQGQRAWALLRFPLELLPRNITLEDAGLVLQLSGFQVPTDPEGRTYRLHEVRNNWTEDEVTWEQARLFNVGIAAVDNVTLDSGFFGGGATEVEFGNDGFTGGLSESLRKYLRRDEPYYGHLIRDEGEVVANLPQTLNLRSSSDLNEAAERPRMVIAFHPNNPEIRNLVADGLYQVNATRARLVNLSFEVGDPLGAVRGAWINATRLDGTEVFNRSVFENRTTVFRNFDRHTVWTNASLDLPDGDYVINAFSLDDDGNLNWTQFKNQANLTVEHGVPFLNQSRDPNGARLPFLDRVELDEGQTFVARLNATDGSVKPHGNSSGIGRVTLALERGGEVVQNLSLRQVTRYDGNGSGDYELVVNASAAGFLNATLWVEDRAGNVNRTAPIALHIRDRFDPVILEAAVKAPGSEDGSPVQEEGGVVAWEVRVRDASPVTVTLQLSTPAGGPPEVVPMVRVGLTDVYRYERVFAVRGAYGATVVARDPDGNTATRAQLGFFIREATPPVIRDPSPPPGGFGQGRGTLSAIIQDLNIDPGSITLETRVGTGGFLPAEPRTVTVASNARRVEVEDTFFHGEVVEVRVRATDLLGRSAERTWSFTVDARNPATFLTTEGPALAGNRTAITGNTTLRLDRQDQGSGVLATVVAIVNEATETGTGNLTITGSGPAFLNLSASPVFTGTGNYTLFFSTVDVAGNVEPTQTRRYLLDDAPPRVTVEFEPGKLTARVDERGTGLREVRAFYWLAPDGQQGQTLMSPNTDRTVWQAQVPDVERGAQVLYAVEAVDLLGNTGRAGSAANPLRSIVQNHRPVLTITPGNGSLVRGEVAIEWQATDRDGDAVETRVAVRPSTSDTARELAPRRGPQGSVTWDTRADGDGLWVIEVTARDAFETVVQRSFVEVTNTDSKVAGFGYHSGQPGEPMRLEATLYRPVQRAEAVVVLGGAEVARVTLLDDGGAPDRQARDGVFTGQFTPARPGDYRLDLEVRFADGRLESRDGIATAAVQYAFPQRIWNDPVLLVLAIVVPAALVGFVLLRRYGPPRALRKYLR